MSDTDDIKKVAVVGAGTMGPGMAVVFASHGYDVSLMDIKPEVLERARQATETALDLLKGNGLLTAEACDEARRRLEFTLDQAEAVDEADVVVEAIPERLELKQDFFRNVEDQVRDDTILASNTSGIPVTSLGEVCRHPSRVVGMHWSNPPHVIPVVEVIQGERTSQATVDRICQLTEAIGMVPVVVQRDVPGFVENRILYAIMREALHVLEEGVATAEDIDKVVRWGIGFKLSVIGPLELLDVAGLDIYDSVASYLNAELSASSGVSHLIREKVEAGDLGIKTGEGLFEYSQEEVPSLMKERLQRLLTVRAALGVD